VLFCVDAIQTLGAVRFDATHVDFVCADGHKWLLAPNGIAILWSRRGALEQLHPALLGWLAPQNRDNWFDYDTTPINNAERFEPGARNYLGVVALDAALALHEEAGVQWVEERVTHLRDHAARVLGERGCPLLWHPEHNLPGGIVSFQAPDGQTAALYQKLDQGFALSLRQAKDGAEWIRVSAHWMNTTGDIDALAAQIQDAEN
jgi:selenocysteine lyase/cysteine desulfurase